MSSPTAVTFADVQNAINDLITSNTSYVQASTNKGTTSSALLSAQAADTAAGATLESAESDLEDKFAALSSVAAAYEATLPPAAPPATA
jgi:hypothetical protein